MIGKDECLNQFWCDYSVDVKKLSLKRKYNQYLALTTVEDNAVKALCTESNSIASHSGSSSEARQATSVVVNHRLQLPT